MNKKKIVAYLLLSLSFIAVWTNIFLFVFTNKIEINAQLLFIIGAIRYFILFYMTIIHIISYFFASFMCDSVKAYFKLLFALLFLWPLFFYLPQDNFKQEMPHDFDNLFIKHYLNPIFD